MKILFTLLLLAIPFALAQAAETARKNTCEVRMAPGWTNPEGSSAAMTARSGESCSGWLYVSGKIKAVDLAITQAPSNGTASVSENEFRYRSQDGYTGADSFKVKASGTGPDGRFHVLTGTVTVTVK